MHWPILLSFLLILIPGAFVAWHGSLIVPYRYMDEEFHVVQAQRLCGGDVTTWDPKLTTPAGLYLLSASLLGRAPAIARGVLNAWKATSGPPSEELLGEGEAGCPLLALRFTGALAVAGTAAIGAWLSLLLRPKRWAEAVVIGATVALWPLTFFFAGLYYTDPLSTALVLLFVGLSRARGTGWGEGSLLATSSFVMTAIGCLALAVRQTNAVWILFGGVVTLEARRQHRESSLLRLAADAALAPVATAVTLLPHVVCGAAFGLFVLWNGGHVPLGDHDNHTSSLHGANACYCAAVVAAALWAVWVRDPSQACVDALWFASGSRPAEPVPAPERQPAEGVSTAAGRTPGPVRRRNAREASLVTAAPTPSVPAPARAEGPGTRLSATWAAVGAACLLVAAWAAARFSTIAHPFLLSDNRHYTFYLWNRVLGWSDLLRESLAPAYAMAALLVGGRVARGASLATAQAFLACSALVVVVTPLVELRYFSVSASLALVLAKPSWSTSAALAASFAAVNAITLWIFWYKPFAATGSFEESRFMW